MKVILLDGYNLMHRARFGMKMGDSHIVFNFFRGLRPIVEETCPDKIYLVLEGYPAHRIAVDPDYKANRSIEPGTPKALEMEEFRRQKKIIIELLDNFPITLARHPHLECDDTIASLCVDVHKDDECVIISTDTDFMQLLDKSERIKLFNPVKKEYIKSTEYDYLRWKALRGDKTDNVPRVDGMSDKKAEKMLADPILLERFLSDANIHEQFNRNMTLIAFKTGDPDGIVSNDGNPSWVKIKKSFVDYKFFSMVNDTAWNNYVKTFACLLPESCD